ncbi:MAG TPA: hypothetical protein VMT64_11290 [Candidatus Binataceae bacterium]|nr:hypothetical protein [Candidatus Binataceae bacterium]
MLRRVQLKEEHLSPRLAHVLRELEYIIVSEGFLHLNTDVLAQRVRCSKRALYSLAPTRKELLLLLIARVLDRTDRYLTRIAAGAPDPRTGLTQYMNAIVRASRTASARFLRDLTAFAPGMRLLQQHQRRTFDRLERLIRNGIEAGVFNDINPKLVAELIAMAAPRLVDPSFQRKLGLNLAQSYEELSVLLDHGLLPNGKSRAARAAGASDGTARARRTFGSPAPAISQTSARASYAPAGNR